MKLLYLLVFVAVLGAANAQPVGEEAAPANQLEDMADLGADQPQEGEATRSRRWLWGGWGGIGGWGGGWNRGWGGGWGGGHSGGWGGSWRVSYQPWSSGSSYWW